MVGLLVLCIPCMSLPFWLIYFADRDPLLNLHKRRECVQNKERAHWIQIVSWCSIAKVINLKYFEHNESCTFAAFGLIGPSEQNCKILTFCSMNELRKHESEKLPILPWDQCLWYLGYITLSIHSIKAREGGLQWNWNLTRDKLKLNGLKHK